jgi:hypothetical protein
MWSKNMMCLHCLNGTTPYMYWPLDVPTYFNMQSHQILHVVPKLSVWNHRYLYVIAFQLCAHSNPFQMQAVSTWWECNHIDVQLGTSALTGGGMTIGPWRFTKNVKLNMMCSHGLNGTTPYMYGPLDVPTYLDMQSHQVLHAVPRLSVWNHR